MEFILANAGDGLGSVAALSNTSGTIAEQYRYDAFGNTRVLNGSGTEITDPALFLGNPYMFTARRLDPETRATDGSYNGLYYYRARMYYPELGRFMQTDPIGYYDSMNLYQYCGNNPVNWIDPLGLYEDGLTHGERAKRRLAQGAYHLANFQRIMLKPAHFVLVKLPVGVAKGLVAAPVGIYKTFGPDNNVIKGHKMGEAARQEVRDIVDDLNDGNYDSLDFERGTTLDPEEFKECGKEALQEGSFPGTGISGSPIPVPTQPADIISDAINEALKQASDAMEESDLN